MKNVEQNTETLDNSDEAHLYLFFYLIPIFGFFPSLWTLYRGVRGEGQGVRGNLRGARKESRDQQGTAGEQTGQGSSLSSYKCSSFPHPSPLTPHPSLAVSRLSVTLAFTWLLAYLLLNIGAEASEFLTLRLLVLNSLLTSGYFLVSIWLMFRIASRSRVRLPGFTSLSQVIGKYLS